MEIQDRSRWKDLPQITGSWFGTAEWGKMGERKMRLCFQIFLKVRNDLLRSQYCLLTAWWIIRLTGTSVLLEVLHILSLSVFLRLFYIFISVVWFFFYCWVLFWVLHEYTTSCLFTCWWAFGLFLVLGYYEESCYKHLYTRALVGIYFLILPSKYTFINCMFIRNCQRVFFK